MKTLGLVLGTLLTLGVSYPSEACPIRHRAVVVQQVVVQKVVVQKVVAVEFVPVYVQSYFTGAAPGYGTPVVPQPMAQPQAQARTPCDKELDALKAKVAALEAKLDARPAPEPAKQEAKAVSHLQVFQAKCAACHEAQAAKKEGGGFVLLREGALVPLSGRQMAKLAGKVYTDKMPPPKNEHGIAPLTDPEVRAVMVWVDAQKSPEKEATP